MSREARWTRERVCEHCGRSYLAARSDSRSCSPRCKKGLQRRSQTRRDWCTKNIGKPSASLVPSIAAVNLNHPLCQAWPQGQLVTFLYGPGGWKPGRINWHSDAGQQCLRSARMCTRHSDIDNTWQIPVEDLRGCDAVFAWDVRKA